MITKVRPSILFILVPQEKYERDIVQLLCLNIEQNGKKYKETSSSSCFFLGGGHKVVSKKNVSIK